MNEQTKKSDDVSDDISIDPTQTRFLTPDMCRIHLGTHNALHLTIKNDRIYGGIFAAYVFPVAHPNKYISLIFSGGVGGNRNEMEVGIIRDLDEFPDEDAELVRKALDRRYFVHIITKIYYVGWKYGFIFLEVETDKGPISFFMTRQHHRAVDYGQLGGKFLLDVDENRYLIPDMSKLPDRERIMFQRLIYW